VQSVIPCAKVGGLADVVGALPKYQNNAGHKARVVVPSYDNKFIKENDFESVHLGHVKLGSFNFSIPYFKRKKDILGFELYLIEILSCLIGRIWIPR
jgi:starch synthase